VNTDADLEPVDLVTIPVDIETNIAIETVTVAGLPADWRTYPAPPALAMIGERWLRESTSAVLSVPSVVIPTERNFILNPTHPDFTRLVINPSEPFSFDPQDVEDERLIRGPVLDLALGDSIECNRQAETGIPRPWDESTRVPPAADTCRRAL